MTRRPFALLIAGLAFVSGCQGCFGCSTSPVDGDGSTLPRTCQSQVPNIDPQKLDILFVVDNSNSMAAKQERVAVQLIDFIAELKKGGGVRNDFHVGVITTSVYLHPKGSASTYEDPTAGRLRPIPNRVPLPDGGVWFDINTNNQRFIDGDDPDLNDKFTRLVHQGVGGYGQETPFEAVRLALLSELATTSIADGGNAEFFRDGARLLVVVVTDEDDCSETNRPPTVTIGSDTSIDDCLEQTNSLTPVSEYHRLFSEQVFDGTGKNREVLWAAIAPVGQSTKQVQQILDDARADGGAINVRNIDCPDSFAPGYRHRQMAEMFDPSLANLDSVCDQSYQETLLRIADLAGVSQVLEIRNVPDPDAMQILITRADGSTQACTTPGAGNGGIEVLPAGAAAGVIRVRFRGDCLRRANDSAVDVRLLCAI